MRPLDGITVVAIEQAVAAPLATRHLADLGARVIKIERPGTGDFARQYDETIRGLGSAFAWLNRSKESLVLDLKHPAAHEVMMRLLGGADVLVQNLAPGAAASLGFGSEQLCQKFPRLIACDISGYGDRGPYRDKKAYDLLIQGEAGLDRDYGYAGKSCQNRNFKRRYCRGHVRLLRYSGRALRSGKNRQRRTHQGFAFRGALRMDAVASLLFSFWRQAFRSPRP